MFKMTARVFALAIALASVSESVAGVMTFDTATDLTDNFDVDVIPGDDRTEWRAGYGASFPYPGSDGGFAHFNLFDAPNSLRFSAGPVFLNSLDLSSQYDFAGGGVGQAASSGGEYNLVLFDEFFNPLYDEDLEVASEGEWETIVLNVPNVSIIWIDTFEVGENSSGFWPNVDNVVFNEPVEMVPEPASLAMFAGLGVIGLVGVRRRRARR